MSLVLHALALAGMIAGLKRLAPPAEERALELRLIPEPRLWRKPAPAHQARAGRVAARPRRTPPSPQPPPEPALAAAPAPPLSRPGDAPEAAAGPKALLPGFRERLGCDDPAAFHLTTEQRQACAKDLGRLARSAGMLDILDLPDRKRAEYDNYERCLKRQQTAPVPSMDPNDPSSGAEVLPGGLVRGVGLGDPAGCVVGRW